MKDAVLLELAARWEREAVEPQCEDGSPEAAIGNAKAHGRRQGLRECADALRMLIRLLGGQDTPEPMLVGKRAVSSEPAARRGYGTNYD